MDDHHDQLLHERIPVFLGAMFLFGLAIILALHLPWLFLLPLLWMVGIPILLIEEGWLGLWVIAQAAIWLFGLPLALWTHLLVPGILALAGCSALLVALFPPDRLDARHQQRRKRRALERFDKPKRHLPLPELLAEDDDEWADSRPDLRAESAAHRRAAR